MIHRQPEAKLTRRQKTGFGIIAVLIFLLLFGSQFAGAFSEWLWYLEDAHAPQVFAVRFDTRLILFFVGFLIFGIFTFVNLRIALQATAVMGPTQDSPLAQVAEKMLQFGRRAAGKIAWIAGPVVGILFGFGLRGSWEEFLLWTHAQPFNLVDPVFGRDVGFYVFKLPFLQEIAAIAIMGVLVPGIAVAAIYLGGQGIAGAGRLNLSIPRAATHLNVLIGLLFLAIGWNVWLGRFGLLYQDGPLFSGMGYTDANANLPVLTLLSFGFWFLGAICVLMCNRLRGFRTQIGGLAGLAVVWVLGSAVYGSILQGTVVRPNQLEKETPYIERAIKFTRQAYMLDKIAVRKYEVREEPTKEDFAVSQTTLDNMRLWDPNVVKSNYNGVQVITQFYDFADVDVDRYMINGKQRMVNLGARELDIRGLDPSARTWQNLRFQYTHGFGIVVSEVHTSDAEGRPNFLLADLSPAKSTLFPITDPRLYFSEHNDDPVFVRSRIKEIASSNSGDDLALPPFQGAAGLNIGSFSRRLLFALAYGEFNIMTTEAFKPDTKLLIHRNILDRASSVFPFLRFDFDPYPVIVDGRILWFLDGYTMTDRFPYSAFTGSFNYIRNSVKVTIDAATGEVHGYVFDAQDPIVQTYRRIYPGLLQDASQMPDSQKAHIRYPETMFRAQSEQLRLYHVTDPTTWYQKQDQWALPKTATETGEDKPMEPYYVQMRLPDEDLEGFLMMLPFTPRERPNLTAWLGAHCDPDRYGQLVLYQFPRDKSLNGPRLAANRFFQNEEISKWTTLVGQRGSEVKRGNLLVMPLGKSILYVEPLFIQSTGDRPLPELRKVALATQRRVVFGDTYAQALQRLFGQEAAPAAPTAPTGAQPTQGTAQKAFDELQSARRAAKDALSRGDWAAYGEAQEREDKALELLGRLLQNPSHPPADRPPAGQ